MFLDANKLFGTAVWCCKQWTFVYTYIYICNGTFIRIYAYVYASKEGDLLLGVALLLIPFFPSSNWNFKCFWLVFTFLLISYNAVFSFYLFVIRLESVLLWKYCLPFARVNILGITDSCFQLSNNFSDKFIFSKVIHWLYLYDKVVYLATFTDNGRLVFVFFFPF